MAKLNDKKIGYIIRHKEKGDLTNWQIAVGIKIGERRIQQLYKEYRETGEVPKLSNPGRPKRMLTNNEMEIIEQAYNETFVGARLLRYHILRHYKINIPHNKIHEYLLAKGYAKENKRKKKKRKRCRYERKHSLSLVHADWSEHDSMQLIGYEDDASRRILAIGEFANATSSNSIKVLNEAEREAESFNSRILAINTDRGTQFYANKQNKKENAETEFQKYLRSKGIKHIPSRRNNPQTNGKIERWIQEYKRHRHRFTDAKEFMDWYNNRLHGALDLENAETPNEAFIRKLRQEALLGLFIKNFMEKYEVI